MTRILELCERFGWCRADPPGHPLTNHHPNCPHVNDSLIDIWKVEYDGESYYTNIKPDPSEFEEGEIVTKEQKQMHREVYDHLPEFQGF